MHRLFHGGVGDHLVADSEIQVRQQVNIQLCRVPDPLRLNELWRKLGVVEKHAHGRVSTQHLETELNHVPHMRGELPHMWDVRNVPVRMRAFCRAL